MTHLRRWLYVGAGLILIDVAVRGLFVPRIVQPRYKPPGVQLLRDRTNGQNLAILFDSVRDWFRSRGTTARIIIAGDSTVHGELPEENSVPYRLQEALRVELAPASVDVIDFSGIGMYARETLIAVTEALKFNPDVLVCQLALRDVIDDEWAGKATNVEAFVGDPWVLRTLPWPIIRQRYSADTLITSAIERQWALFTYRSEVRAAFLRALRVNPSAQAPQEPRRGKGMDGILSDRLYHFPNTNSKSIEAMMQACRRARGHCFVYVGPFNPAVSTDNMRASVTRFRAMVRRAAQESGVEFEDFWDALAPSYFRQRQGGGPDPIHYNAPGYQRFGRMLAQRIEGMIVTQRIAEQAARESRWVPRR